MQARIRDFELEEVESVVQRLWCAIATVSTMDEAWAAMSAVLKRHRCAVRIDERQRVARFLRARAGELVCSQEPLGQVTELLATAELLEDHDESNL